MEIDSYFLTRTSALFVRAGCPIPAQFIEQHPKPAKRAAFFDDPQLIADIESQGWHVRTVKLHLTVEIVSAPKR